jgi:UDP-2,4-diacetamido-2,4,6-trideoxy-beta-L-altropyranose hydrolase
MRCLTLADKLRDQGADIRFISQRLPGEMSQTITARGYSCQLIEPTIHSECPHESPAGKADLQTDANATIAAMSDTACDWVIVDQYQLHDAWYEQIRSNCRHILTIDDLANRTHDCDVLQDQTLGRQASDYGRYTRERCKLLLGTDYALLRPEFSQCRQQHANSIVRSGPVKTLMIGLGGSDARNLALEILQRIEPLLAQHNITAMLVAGPQYQHAQTVRDWARTSQATVEVHHDVREVAPLLLRADLAIGASGSSAWERCCLGLPTLAFIYADNQIEIANRLAAAGASINWQTLDELHRLLAQLIDGDHKPSQSPNITSMSRHASRLCDGNGAQRVIDAMMSL